MLLEEKRKIWKSINSAGIKVNADFTQVINDSFRIEISLSKYKDEDIDLLCNLFQDDLMIYHVEHVPVDDINVALDALEDIAYTIHSKIITKVDEELLASNGNIDCDYSWFMEHASYVLDNPFYREYAHELDEEYNEQNH